MYVHAYLAALLVLVTDLVVESCMNEHVHQYHPSECTGTYTIKWNLSIKDTLNEGHHSNEDTVCSPNHIELCTNLPLN